MLHFIATVYIIFIIRRDLSSMDHSDFRQTFQSCVHIRKMANIEYTPDFLIPNSYHYEKKALEPFSPEDFLYLLGGGSIHADTPLSFRFSSMDCHLLLLTSTGSGRITTSGRREISADDRNFICFDCNQNFSLQSVVLPWNFKIFFISGNTLSAYSALLGKSSGSFSLSQTSSVTRCVQSLLSIPEDPDAKELLLMHQNLTSILAGFCCSCCSSRETQQPEAPWYLTEIRDFLDNHYREEFSLKYFEDTLRMSRYRLCREFSSFYGIPPLRYLTEKRLAEAKKILLTTDHSIHEVSSMIGYENTNHFINIFKKYAGLTPGKFRQKALEDRFSSHFPVQ